MLLQIIIIIIGYWVILAPAIALAIKLTYKHINYKINQKLKENNSYVYG